MVQSLLHDVRADHDAFITDIDTLGAGDQLCHLVFGTAAEGTSAGRLHFSFICHI